MSILYANLHKENPIFDYRWGELLSSSVQNFVLIKHYRDLVLLTHNCMAFKINNKRLLILFTFYGKYDKKSHTRAKWHNKVDDAPA